MFKAGFKALLPARAWAWMRECKEYAKERLHPERRFWHYYEAARDYQKIPEPFLEALVLPAYVEEIVDYGCASGRNFIPFDGKYRLVGLDIVPWSRIKWVQPFSDLIYRQRTFYEFTRELEHRRWDLSRSLVLVSAVLMYIPRRWQLRFYRAAYACGCRNFVFIENPPGTRSFGRTFKMPLGWFKAEKNGERTSIAYTQLQP